MGRAVDAAYQLIREAVLSGEFAPGTHLAEELLAERAGVSRTPVREALRLLDAEGFVESVSNQGSFVATWSDKDLEEIFRLRAVFESYGAGLAAQQVDEKGLRSLRELADAMVEICDAGKPDADRLTELNNAFHQCIFEVAGNQRLFGVYKTLVAVPLVHRTFEGYTRREVLRSVMHHEELVDAFSCHDGEWAASVMRSHVLAALHSVKRRSRAAGPPTV